MTKPILYIKSNLAELLEAGHEGIAPTLRDEKLREEAKVLQNKYLSKYVLFLHSFRSV